MKIIITGSLGNISLPLTQDLVQQGHAVTVISSNEAKRTAITALGAVAAIGSLEDGAFLTTVFTGADAVYAMVPPDFFAADPLAHYEAIGNSYAQAIRQSGVSRIVQLSSWGAHLPEGTGMIVGSYLVEQLLNQLDNVAITYLRPASFYTNLYHYIDMIKGAGFIGANFGGPDKLVMVAPADIALAAAAALLSPASGKEVRYVASDERSCTEIAAVLGAAIGMPALEWRTFTDAQVTAAMIGNGLPPHIAQLLVTLNASIHSGLIRSDFDLHPPQMGQVKLEDFAQDFAAAFHQK